MDELDFSEKACLERYIHFPYFDEDCEGAGNEEDFKRYDGVLRVLKFGGCEEWQQN